MVVKTVISVQTNRNIASSFNQEHSLASLFPAAFSIQVYMVSTQSKDVLVNKDGFGRSFITVCSPQDLCSTRFYIGAFSKEQ